MHHAYSRNEKNKMIKSPTEQENDVSCHVSAFVLLLFIVEKYID